MDRLPTWPEMARSIVNMWLYAQDEEQKAIASGVSKEAKAWAKQVRALAKMMQKNRITVRYA